MSCKMQAISNLNTNFDYFGARYYSSKESVWLSVDPLASRYPSMSPFMYTAGNPVMLVDPDGRWVKGAGLLKNIFRNDQRNGAEVKAKELRNKGYEADVARNSKRDYDVTFSKKASGNTYGEVGIANYSKKKGGSNIAKHIRNSRSFLVPFLNAYAPNPFYKAEAISVDIGIQLVGAERDFGFYYVLAGKDEGKFKSFNEIAGGGSNDASFGIEVGRIDVSGDNSTFMTKDLYGKRNKGTVGLGVFPFSLSGAIAVSRTRNGRLVTATSVSGGVGVSPFVISFGGNTGEIK